MLQNHQTELEYLRYKLDTCNSMKKLNELRAKLESKKTLSKEYNQEIRMLKTKYVTTDKSLTRRLNKSFESESDQQKSLLELLEIEKSKSNALNLKIDKVRMTISKQDEEMVFLRQKHEKLSKQINEVEYKFEAFKEQQSATLLLNEKDTSLGEVRKAYTDKRTEIDTFEKFYIEQLAHFRQAKEEQEERYDTLLKKFNIIRHRLQEYENKNKSIQAKLSLKPKEIKRRQTTLKCFMVDQNIQSDEPQLSLPNSERRHRK